MTVKIIIKYKTTDEVEWKTVNFLPEEYFDLTINEKTEWNSVPEYDHAIDYLDVDLVSISNTQIRISDDELGIIRLITTTFWHNGQNRVIERVDSGPGISSYLMVITNLLQENPSIWEVIRFGRDNGILNLKFHSFIQDNEDGSEMERKVFPVDASA